MSIVKSDNDKGNPYHSGENGQFVSATGEQIEKDKPLPLNAKINVAEKYLPKDKDFYIDYSNPKERGKIRLNEKKYSDRFEQKLEKIGYNYVHHNTMNIIKEHPERLMEDKEKVEKYLDKQVRENNIPANRECTIVIGLPGAGKSFFAEKMAKTGHASLEVDSDIFKNMIPEFQQDEDMVSAVHDESALMCNHFRDEAIKKGLNITIGKVGGDVNQMKEIVEKMIKAGYEVKMKAVLVSQSTAVDRAINRYDRGETKRVVPFDVFNCCNGIVATLNNAINNGWCSEVEIYDNDVPRGEKPVLLNKGETNNSIKYFNYKKSLEEKKANSLFNLK